MCARVLPLMHLPLSTAQTACVPNSITLYLSLTLFRVRPASSVSLASGKGTVLLAPSCARGAS